MIPDRHVGLTFQTLSVLLLMIVFFLLPREIVQLPLARASFLSPALTLSGATDPTSPTHSFSSKGLPLLLTTALLNTFSKNDEPFGCHHPDSGPIPSWECGGHSPASVPLLSGPSTVALMSLHPDVLRPVSDERILDLSRTFFEIPSDTPDRPPTSRSS